MTQEELITAINHAVTLYTNSPEYFDSNPQLRINPATLDVTIINGNDMMKGIAFSDEAIEEEALVDGDESESATDFQASQDPDFFPVKKYVRIDVHGKNVPDMKMIKKLAETYID